MTSHPKPPDTQRQCETCGTDDPTKCWFRVDDRGRLAVAGFADDIWVWKWEDIALFEGVGGHYRCPDSFHSTPDTQPPGDRIWYVADQEPIDGNGLFNGPQIASGTALVEASHASALQDELDALREKAGQLWQRVAEQQNVETVYGQGEASDEEMFTATAAAYSAANRLHRLLSKESPDA